MKLNPLLVAMAAVRFKAANLFFVDLFVIFALIVSRGFVLGPCSVKQYL